MSRGSGLARQGPPPGTFEITVATLDMRHVSEAMTRCAEQFSRTMTMFERGFLRSRYAAPRTSWDRETEERLHRFRDREPDAPDTHQRHHEREQLASWALRRQLGQRRWAKLASYGWVIIEGGLTGDPYRVDCSPPGNILRQTDGVRMCLAHPSHDAPVAALLACQIFLLEHDEPRFLSNANFLGIGGHQESIPPWIIEACCFPRSHYVTIPTHDIYARIPVTPPTITRAVHVLTPDMLRYDPVLNVRDGQTDEARAAGILIEAPNEPGGPVAPYEPPEWDRGREWD